MPPRRKSEDPPKAGAPAWMATFSDMVTLLLAFFVMLVAMANFEDTRRIGAVVESIRTALGVNGFDAKLVGSTAETAFTQDQRREQSLQPVVAKLREAFSKHVSDDFVRMVQNEQELRVRLDEKVFFQSGSTTLHPTAFALITDLGARLARENVHVRVEGYADGTGSEMDNWRLSGERALSVVMALRQRGPIDGERLEAVARGSFHPSASIGESEDWSRRVEIVLTTNDLSGAAAAGAWME